MIFSRNPCPQIFVVQKFMQCFLVKNKYSFNIFIIVLNLNILDRDVDYICIEEDIVEVVCELQLPFETSRDILSATHCSAFR